MTVRATSRKKRRARALLRAGGGRLAVDPSRVILLRRLGDRSVAMHDPAAVRKVEHLFTTRTGDGLSFLQQLDFLQEVASSMPHLMFADFWHGYMKFLCAEVMLSRGRQR